jgi:hypothetical protein
VPISDFCSKSLGYDGVLLGARLSFHGSEVGETDYSKTDTSVRKGTVHHTLDYCNYVLEKWVLSMNHKEIGWGTLDWIDLTQDKNKWRVLVNAVINCWVP